jgi:beta-galactosidase/beta-glucuronidase
VRITVGVDNTLTNETIPPGQLLTNQYGKKQQKYWHDFFNFAGLHRSVRLFTKPLIAVEDVTVTKLGVFDTDGAFCSRGRPRGLVDIEQIDLDASVSGNLDVVVTTDLDGSTGVVNYNVKIAGDARVEVDLLDVDQSAGSI